jgi:hypothetical protein
MPATFHSGVGGSLSAGGTTFAVLDWQFTTANKLVDVTNSGSSGYEEYITSTTGGSGSANCLWDSTSIPDNGAPGKLEPFRGTSGSNDLVAFELICGNSAKKYSFNAVIESLAVTNNATGGDAVKFSVSFKSSGTITPPS